MNISTLARKLFPYSILFSFLLLLQSCGKLPNPAPDLDFNLGDAIDGGDNVDPRDASNNYGGGPAIPFDFGGSYQGPCEARAMGLSSRSCSAGLVIYHEEGASYLSYAGSMAVDMYAAKGVYPVGIAPLLITDNRLLDPDTGADYGGIDHTGFMVVHDNGDWMKFLAGPNDGFDYEGVYTDPDYGQVSVTGQLEKSGDLSQEGN